MQALNSMCSGVFLLCLVRIAMFYYGRYVPPRICKCIQLRWAPDSCCWGVLFFRSAFSCLQHLLSIWPYHSMETRKSCMKSSCLDHGWCCLCGSLSSSPSRDLFSQWGGEGPPACSKHKVLCCAVLEKCSLVLCRTSLNWNEETFLKI